jgi:uncharacterized protein (DUF1778 family)
MKASNPQPRLRTRRFEIRLTADEYAVLDDRSAEVGMTVSDYMRRSALKQKFVSKNLFKVSEAREPGRPDE